ncbi:MAG: hypothetical protein H6805_04625 [Planctomycetes bacterium]|nr:hypothetical protein [Planctomycetota bacterium]
MAATAAPKKKPTLAEALDVLEGIFGAPPQPERIEDPLLDHLLVAVLTPHMGQPAARDALRALSGAFLDLNELRVCGLAEIEPFLSAVPAASRRQAAWDLRMALQDVYDGTHGLDLEPLRGRAPEDMRKFLKTLPNIHGGAAALLFQAAAGDDVLAFGTLEEHLLTRLGMLPRASSRDRVRAALERQVKAKDRRRFAWLCGAAAHLYEVDFDPKHPFCDLLVRVNAKELAVREAERKREEARRLAEEKKRLAEEEKQRKAEERERAKAERERARLEAAAKRKAAAEAKAAAKKAAEEKKRADAKAAAEAKKAAAKAAVEAKKAAAKAAAEAKKAAEKAKREAAKKAAAAKKEAAKKAAAKKAAKKKAAKKKAAKKKTAKKTAAKKTASKKAPAKKAVKKTAAKKTSTKKTAAKKPPAKKAAKKKSAKKAAPRAPSRVARKK